MRFHPQRFKALLPELRDYLTTLLPRHVATYDSFVRRLGEDCVYARATLKVIFIEAKTRDEQRFAESLRARGYFNPEHRPLPHSASRASD